MYAIGIAYGPDIDYRHCDGCGVCYEHCPMDIFAWDEQKKLPIVAYPGECCFCCFCEVMCPQMAIDVRFPVHHLLDFGIDVSRLKRETPLGEPE
jgi:NAD-dependent dihydropyrimidine dehydrogenase PreA subunit